MSPLPHFPHWRPGLHPGAEGRGTGLDPHHHHRALHHPPHSQRKHGTWKGQRRHKDGMNDAGDRGDGEGVRAQTARADIPFWVLR